MHRLVLTTCGSRSEAEKIAHALVEGRFAACVNIVPEVHSVYRWEGSVESADEMLLIIKTTADKADHVRQKITELHSYDLPEVVVLDIAGSEQYLAWITDSTR
jgi:periplasmic divalent cation tolerance protein